MGQIKKKPTPLPEREAEIFREKIKELDKQFMENLQEFLEGDDGE